MANFLYLIVTIQIFHLSYINAHTNHRERNNNAVEIEVEDFLDHWLRVVFFLFFLPTKEILFQHLFQVHPIILLRKLWVFLSIFSVSKFAEKYLGEFTFRL